MTYVIPTTRKRKEGDHLAEVVKEVIHRHTEVMRNATELIGEVVFKNGTADGNISLAPEAAGRCHDSWDALPNYRAPVPIKTNL